MSDILSGQLISESSYYFRLLLDDITDAIYRCLRDIYGDRDWDPLVNETLRFKWVKYTTRKDTPAYEYIYPAVRIDLQKMGINLQSLIKSVILGIVSGANTDFLMVVCDVKIQKCCGKDSLEVVYTTIDRKI